MDTFVGDRRADSTVVNTFFGSRLHLSESQAAAKALGMIDNGVAKVRIELLNRNY